jgi:hypothetical protein
MKSCQSYSLIDKTLIVGAPLTLAILECFHPHPHDLLQIDLQRWLTVHYVQVVLFPLTALALVTLLRVRHDIPSYISRVALFIFGVSYVAFDTAAGIVTGILIKAARESGNAEAWRPALDAVWAHPIMGGSPMTAPLLAIFGSIALSVGAVFAAVSLRRSGVSWLPLILMAASSFGIGIFKTHAWPGGPVTFGGIAIASAWVLLELSRHSPQVPAVQ